MQGGKMMNLEGNEFDVPSSIRKGLNYKLFGAMKFLPNVKEIFDKLHKAKKRRCRYDIC
jgi:hypothetical protein